MQSELSSLNVKELKDQLSSLRNEFKALATKNASQMSPEERKKHSATLNAVIDKIEACEAALEGSA